MKENVSGRESGECKGPEAGNPGLFGEGKEDQGVWKKLSKREDRRDKRRDWTDPQEQGRHI